jgi:hypothetical protein
MRNLKRIYHFLSGIYFAVILIALVTVFVVAGTVLEAMYDSHRYAAIFTYRNPVFLLLLTCFFVNILLSALRRWPFRKRHIPFLITHCGLLMILGGSFIKSLLGLQGSIGLREGSGSQEVYIPSTYVLKLEKRMPDERVSSFIPIEQPWFSSVYIDEAKAKASEFPELHFEILAYHPHSHPKLDSWISDSQTRILGLRSFATSSFLETGSPPIIARAALHQDSDMIWNIYACQVANVQESAKSLYASIFSLKREGDAFLPLSQVEEKGLSLNLDLSPDSSINELSISSDTMHLTPDTLPKAGYSLHGKPSLALFQDLLGDSHLFAFSEYGEAYYQAFRADNLDKLVVIDHGFGGYAVQAEIPFSPFPHYRENLQDTLISYHSKELRNAIADGSKLSPPLLFLQESSEAAGGDFSTQFFEILKLWKENNTCIFGDGRKLSLELRETLSAFKWETVPKTTRSALNWAATLLHEIERHRTSPESLLSYLKERGWPHTSLLVLQSGESVEAIITGLIRQIFSLSEQLPDVEFGNLPTAEKNLQLFTTWLRAYQIHFDKLPPIPSEDQGELLAAGFSLESPISFSFPPALPRKKLEDNTPTLSLKISDGDYSELVHLGYDRFGTGLKHPIFGGKYLIRFQPNYETIPHRIRLRDARQINYPNSQQAYSYESDLIVRENGKKTSNVTISMNNVYETRDGYRFYLANITPPQETTAQLAQIAVNYDPAKYWLTYPGAIIMTLGIVLLFWLKPYKGKE